MDVQSNLLSDLASRVVVPLLPAAETQSVSRLNPIFEIDGQTHVLVVQSIATVPGRELRRAVTSLKGQHDTIPAAIDFLLAGF